MKGVARVAVAVALMTAVGFLSFGVFHSTWAAAATWTSYGNASGEGHDLTPIVALQNGDLMAIGGFNGSAPTTDVEILDHTQKTWGSASAADSLPSAYSGTGLIGAQATLLVSGNLLLTGGRDQSGNATDLAAVWDHTRSGSGAGSNWHVFHMSEARAEHVAVRAAGGNVVVTGGACNGGSDTDVFTEGTGFTKINSCSAGSNARNQAAAVVTQRGDVIITGGTGAHTDSSVTATDSVAIMLGPDIGTGSAAWHPMPAMSSSRLRHTATEVEVGTNLFIVVAGGAGQEAITTTSESLGPQQSSTEVYTALTTAPEGGNWQTGQSLPSARADLASIRVGNKVLIAGGRADGTQPDPADNANGRGITDAFIYDPSSRSSRPTLSMSSGRLNFTLTLVPPASQIIAVGGFRAPTASQNQDVQFATQAELYTPSSVDVTSTRTPTPTTPGPTPRPAFNPGTHPPTLSLPVVHPGEPLRIRANGLDAGRQVVIFLQPVTVNALEACGLGQKVATTASATGTIDTTVIVFDQGAPQLAVTLCVVAPPPAAPSASPVAQAVGRAQLIMQPRSLQPPFVGVAPGR